VPPVRAPRSNQARAKAQEQGRGRAVERGRSASASSPSPLSLVARLSRRGSTHDAHTLASSSRSALQQRRSTCRPLVPPPRRAPPRDCALGERPARLVPAVARMASQPAVLLARLPVHAPRPRGDAGRGRVGERLGARRRRDRARVPAGARQARPALKGQVGDTGERASQVAAHGRAAPSAERRGPRCSRPHAPPKCVPLPFSTCYLLLSRC